MSPLWVVAALVLVVGSIVVGRLAVRLGDLAADTEVALAEAAEVISVVGQDQVEFDSTVNRMSRGADALKGPVRASKHWWKRARR